MTNEYSAVLCHHGIMGMKWGVRRYQNADGSLTAAGEKRYATNLDVSDTTRSNIAKIRLGEARKRLDTAKATNPDHKSEIRKLRRKEREAKAALNKAKLYDKGEERVARGESITGNRARTYTALGASVLASAGMTAFLNSRMSTLSSQGKWTAGHTAVANLINKGFAWGTQGAAMIYGAKKERDNAAIRSYNRAQWDGSKTIKRVGGEEYASRKAEAKKK